MLTQLPPTGRCRFDGGGLRSAAPPGPTAMPAPGGPPARFPTGAAAVIGALAATRPDTISYTVGSELMLSNRDFLQLQQGPPK